MNDTIVRSMLDISVLSNIPVIRTFMRIIANGAIKVPVFNQKSAN